MICILERRRAVLLCLAVFLWAGHVCRAEPTLTDAEKKAAVYRMYAEYKQNKFPEIRDILPAEAMARAEKGEMVFVDIRTPEEQAVSMLPEAVTERQFLSDAARYRDRTVVVYCTVSFRSGLFARRMAARGIVVRNLAGGLLAWVLEGGKVRDRQGETRRIHVFGDEWNYPPAGYAAVRFSLLDRLRKR